MDQQEQQEAGASVAMRSSRESRSFSANQGGSGLMSGEAIVVNMSRLADVLGVRQRERKREGGRCRLPAWARPRLATEISCRPGLLAYPVGPDRVRPAACPRSPCGL